MPKRITETILNPHHITNPQYLQNRLAAPTNQEITVVSDPQGKLTAWHNYFADLHKPTSQPEVPKPWMTSGAAATMKTRTAAENDFTWPQAMTLEDLRNYYREVTREPHPDPMVGKNGRCDVLTMIS